MHLDTPASKAAHLTWLPPMRSLCLASAAAIALSLALPPIHIPFASPLAVALLVIGISRLSGRQALATGWWAGFLSQLIIYWWLIETLMRYGKLPLWAGVVAHVLYALGMGLHLGLTALLATTLMRKWSFRAIEAWPAAYLLVYASLPQIFPLYLGAEYYLLPEPLHFNPPDVLVVSAIVVMLGALAGEWWLLRRAPFASTPRMMAWLVTVALLFAISWPRTLPTHPAVLRIALAQTNHPLRSTMTAEVIENRYQALASMYLEGVAQDAKLVIFSENSLPFSYLLAGQQAPPQDRFARTMTDRLNALITQHRVPMIASGIAWDHGRLTNRAFFIEPMPDGSIRNQIYDKRKLLLLGEHTPLRGDIPAIERFFAKAGIIEFEAGQHAEIWTWNGLKLLPTICYEAILRGFTQSAIPPGETIDLMINLTNDKWFGVSNEQEQHLMLATWRSAETGIPMIRSTRSGVSAVVNGRGAVMMRSQNGVSGVWVTEVPLYRRTPENPTPTH